MKLYENPVYINDIKQILENTDLTVFYGKSIFITGATGLICSAVVDIINESNRISDKKITLYIACRDIDRAKQRFAPSKYVKYVFYDALKPLDFHEKVDFIIHGAGNSSPELYVTYPTETMCMNFEAMHRLLDFALDISTDKVLYISSSEIYGSKTTEDSYDENDYGYIDLLNVRSSYSISKRASETLCHSYAKQHGINVVIARPGHIFGPTASKKDKRISSDFAFKAAKGKDLVMKSAGLQKRSYMYCLDCAAAILKILDRGTSGSAYNVCSDDVLTIKEMASVLANAAGVKLFYNEPTREEMLSFNPMNNSSLCGDKLKALGFNSLFSAEEGLRHTVNILKEIY